MSRKVINTPSLLASQYGSSPTGDAKETQNVKYKSVTEEENKREELIEKQTTQQNQSSTTGTQSGGPSVNSTTNQPQPLNGTYDTDFTLLTRPNEFSFKSKNYNSVSRKGGVPNGKQRTLDSIKFIVLHHTATESLKDKGFKTINGWKNRSASSHAVMDGAGHIEYMIPIRYVANTQGVKYNDPKNRYSKSNICGISIEIQNIGYLNSSETRGGITYWGRKNIKKSNWLKEEFTSQHFDYNLNSIKKYKGQPRSEEYTQAQVNALASWIKEMLKVTGINWRFTEDTYKEMFPNTSLPLSEVPNSGHIINKGAVHVKYKQSSSSPRWSNTYFGISKDFYNKVPGVYTHCSIVPEKIDLCPTYNIVKMLKDNFS